MTYTRYMTFRDVIYLVYTRYIHGINMVYDDINRIPGIYPLKTFSDISVPVTYPSGYGIYFVTGTEMLLKVLSGYIPSIRFMSSNLMFRLDIFRYILGIYLV